MHIAATREEQACQPTLTSTVPGPSADPTYMTARRYALISCLHSARSHPRLRFLRNTSSLWTVCTIRSARKWKRGEGLPPQCNFYRRSRCWLMRALNAPGSNLCQYSRVFDEFTQSVPWKYLYRTWPLPFASYPVSHKLISLPLDATQFELLTCLNPLKPSGHYMYHQFKIHKFHVQSTQCICVYLRTNSDYFPIQH